MPRVAEFDPTGSAFNIPADRAREYRPNVYSELVKRSGADFFNQLSNLTDTFIEHHPAFASVRAVLGEGNESAAVEAVNHKNFNRFDPYKHKDQYKALISAAQSKEQFRRELIKRALGEGNSLGLDPEQRIIVGGFCDIAQIHDDIQDKWREDIVWSPLGVAMHELSPQDKITLPVKLKKMGLNHAYGILVPQNGTADPQKLVRGEEGHGYEEVPYTLRYEAEYRRMARKLGDMEKALGRINSRKGNRYREYLEDWQKMCEEKDLAALDRRAERLDSLWMDLPDDLVLEHPMEYSYYGEDSIRKDMRAYLGVPDPKMKDVLDRCEEQKANIKRYFESEIAKRGGGYPILAKSLQTLDGRTRFLSSVLVTEAMGYDALVAGSSLPNSDHHKVTDEKGKKISIFLDGSNKAWMRRLESWKRVFGPESLHMFDDMNFKDRSVYSTAPHEVGETVSRNASSDERLGNLRSQINEIKSTTAGIAYFGGLAREGRLDIKEAEKIAKLNLLTNLYYLSFWGSPQQEAYYWHGVIGTNLALDCGFLYTDGNSYGIDLSKSGEYIKTYEDHFWEREAPLWESEGKAAERLGADIIEAEGHESLIIKHLLTLLSERYFNHSKEEIEKEEAELEKQLATDDNEDPVSDVHSLVRRYGRRVIVEARMKEICEARGQFDFGLMHAEEGLLYMNIQRSLSPEDDGRLAYDKFKEWRNDAYTGLQRLPPDSIYRPGNMVRVQLYDKFMKIISEAKGITYEPPEENK